MVQRPGNQLLAKEVIQCAQLTSSKIVEEPQAIIHYHLRHLAGCHDPPFQERRCLMPLYLLRH